MELKYIAPYSLEKGSEGAAAYDLRATETIWFGGFTSERSRIVPTGCMVCIPPNHLGLVTLRSGHGFKRGFTSHIGIIDSDYRGEIKVKVFWTDSESKVSEKIKEGERFAQLTIIPIPAITAVKCDSLEATERGEGGFGSTGRT